MDPRLKDNSFNAKSGDAWGSKASDILSRVKGRDFRHEKVCAGVCMVDGDADGADTPLQTKKKRGSYKGGPLTMGTHSFKFSDSEEE